MVVKLNRPDIRYEVESLIRMLLGETPVTIVLPGEAIPDDNDSIAITVQEQEKCCLCHVVACLNGEKREASSPSTVDRTEIRADHLPDAVQSIDSTVGTHSFPGEC